MYVRSLRCCFIRLQFKYQIPLICHWQTFGLFHIAFGPWQNTTCTVKRPSNSQICFFQIQSEDSENCMLQTRSVSKQFSFEILLFWFIFSGCIFIGWLFTFTHSVSSTLTWHINAVIKFFFFVFISLMSLIPFSNSFAMWMIGSKLTMIPVLTAMPRPQYVFGTMSPKPTLKNVIAISLLWPKQMKRTGENSVIN